MKKDMEKEKLTELLAQAEGHPIMQKIKAEKAAAILATRQEASARIEALRKEEADIIPRLQADRQEKELKYQKAKNALQAASDEFQAAHRTLSVESDQISREIGRQEQVLIETADPVIDEETTFFREKLDWLRKPGRISSNRIGGERNLFTEKVTLKVESNVDAVHDALRYCMDAIKELKNMKLIPELDMAGIEALKAGIPRTDIYEEITGEKPMEKVPPYIVPRFGGAADDDYEQTLIDRLHKKINVALWKQPEAKKPVVQTPVKPATPKKGGRR